MGRLILVEELDRRGRVRRLTPVEHLPFRIGRGYDCDLVLDDPHVSPLHCVIERDSQGRLLLRDRHSKNGILPGRNRTTVASVALDGDASVRVGTTLLRLRPPDFPVPEARPIVRRSALAHWMLHHWSAALVLIAIYLTLSELDTYRATTAGYDPMVGLSDSLLGLLLLAGWIGSWALLNRLLRQHTRIVAHTTVACTMFIAALLANWGVEWLRFVVEPVEPLQLFERFLTASEFGLVLVGHLTVMGVARTSIRAGAALLGSAAVLTYQLVGHYAASDIWVYTLPYWSRLKPVDPAWLPVETDADFFARIPALEADLARMTQEILAERKQDSTRPSTEGADAPEEPR